MEQLRRRGKLTWRIRASILTKRPPEEDVVEVLNLYHFCKTFHQLPRPGGVLDQPWKVMFLFEVVSAAESERDIRDQKKADQEAQRARKRA